MSPLKKPGKLINLALKQTTLHILSLCRSRCEWDEQNSQLKDILTSIPYLLVDDIVSEIISQMTYHDTCGKMTSFTFLNGILVPSLKNLDLGVLNNIELEAFSSHSSVDQFAMCLRLQLPSACNLVKLSLATHSERTTLPICTDEILWKVGECCSMLKCLDISNNTAVTNVGLMYIVPSPNSTGCPCLEDLNILDCSVTADCVASILEHMTCIQKVEYSELCLSLAFLKHQRGEENYRPVLKLKYLRNLCPPSRSYSDIKFLHFNKRLATLTNDLCPGIEELRVCLNDEDTKFLGKFMALTKLMLVYDVTTPSSPRVHTEHFLRVHGYKLIVLTLVCDLFDEEHFVTIGDSCPSLEELWVRCNKMNSSDVAPPETNKSPFSRLETFSLRIGQTQSSRPQSLNIHFLVYVLKNSIKLKHLIFNFKRDITDELLCTLWLNINTQLLKVLKVKLNINCSSPIKQELTIDFTYMIISHCPCLEQLGCLNSWTIYPDEFYALQAFIYSKNLDLLLIM